METNNTVAEDGINKNAAVHEQQNEPPFKKPILIGKIGRFPRIVTAETEKHVAVEAIIDSVDEENEADESMANENSSSLQCADHAEVKPAKESNSILPYKEPIWSGMPESSGSVYSFDVLKSGSILETINIMKKPYWVFGRLDKCDIYMQHPTISRYHAVLQYRSQITEDNEPGFYIYDLGSTHGTFLNKRRIKPRIYIKVSVGHMIKLGCSTRTFLLNGPEDDVEEESELSVTELKNRRAEALKKQEEDAIKEQKEKEERLKREEEKGVDWGMGDDADEENDLTENPYAQTNNEELYLDDPKKALRGFMEREGFDLDYDCTEQGMGQFLCKVMLPLDDERGRPIYAEVLHKGKKREAVVQCALEACRILDRHGVLRQATHESRKRKAKNWEENDYYDSDEDTFLDRTGTIEKKRENRMKAKMPQKADTYQSLLEKEKSINASITDIEKRLDETNKRSNTRLNSEEDSLDSYMNELKQSKLDKQAIIKLKSELAKLKQEHTNIVKLINIAKPAELPPIVSQYSNQPSTSNAAKSKFPIYGKRMKVKVQLPTKSKQEETVTGNNENIEVEEEEDEENDDQGARNEKVHVEMVEENLESNTEPLNSVQENNEQDYGSSESDTEIEMARNIASKEHKNIMTLKKFEATLNKIQLAPFIEHSKEKVDKVLNVLKKLATEEDRMYIDWKTLGARRRKVKKLISDLQNNEDDEKLKHRVSMELNRILTELNDMTNKKCRVINTVTKVVDEIKLITDKITEDRKNRIVEEAIAGTSYVTENMNDNCEEETPEEAEKKRRKNQRRIQQRQNRVENDRQKGYEEDASKEDYNMWVPPQNQSGDGRTNLNEKYGY